MVTNAHTRTWNGLVQPVADNLRATLEMFSLLFRPGEVIELRLAEVRSGQGLAHIHFAANGYFNDPMRLAEAAMAYDGKVDAVFFTVNPVRPALLYAAQNEFRRPAGWLATNRDVTRRSSLLLRFESEEPDTADPQAALDRAQQCGAFLTLQGWPEPVVASSGSVGQLLYSIDLPNNAGSTELIKRTLLRIGKRFSDDLVHLDASASNACLLCPLYGTLFRQRFVTGTPSYLRSFILSLPDQLQSVDQMLLEQIAQLPVAGTYPVDEPSEPVAGNSVSQFVRTMCDLTEDAWTPTSILYEAYQIFCHEQELRVVAAPHFARALVAHFGLEADRRKVRGVVTRGLWGIRLDASVYPRVSA